VRHYSKLTLEAADGTKTEIPEQGPTITKSEVVLPGQSLTYKVQVPTGTFYYGNGNIHAKLIVTFSGDSDSKKYFYLIVLSMSQFRKPSEMGKARMDAVMTELVDEGVLTDINQLLN
jgi:hypothetical protein